MKNVEYLEMIRKYFPKAFYSEDIFQFVFSFIRKELNLSIDKVILGDSICADEINSMEYPSTAYELLGPFKLGGLNGYPFTGITGLSAFFQHVPNDGAAIIYYGPHIGITEDESIGQVMRVGQEVTSSCCGALDYGLKVLKGKAVIQEKDDYQMSVLSEMLEENKERIMNSSDEYVEATKVIYEKVDSKIGELLSKASFPSRFIILIGGILINTDKGVDSYFDCNKLLCLDMKNKEEMDILPMAIDKLL
ncbi:MAG: hypothetical protein ACEPOV_12520 [Hyphomicrobiales bacterium]